MQIRLELASCPLFEGLPDEVLSLLARASELVELSGRATLFRQGEQGDALYILVWGRLAAVRQSEEEPDGVILGEIGPGGYVGEMALLASQPRVATIVAVRDSMLIRLPASAFLQVVANYPDCALAVARTVIERSRPQRRPQVDRLKTIAVLPGGPGTAADLSSFAEALREALAAIGPTALVDARSVRDALAGAEAEPARWPADGAVAAYLERLEREHRFVLYASAADDDWRARCIRNADRLLVVIDADDADAEPAAAAAMMRAYQQATLAAAELVVRHPGSAIRGGVAGRWLDTGLFRRHYHVRRHAVADVPRLARLVVGRAYGMALSGGGTRAVACVGALRAFQEAGIEIDIFAGTSGGAVVGAAAAMDASWQEMREKAMAVATIRKWPELGPPFVSIASGHATSQLFRSFYGNTTIEDAPKPFLASCVSIGSGRLVIPERGELWRAVRASTSMPGIFPPVPFGDDLLVDGGLVNNFPVDLIRDRCETVVGCDVSAVPATPVLPQDACAVSGWALLRRKLNPFDSRDLELPTLLSIVTRAAMAGAREHRVRMDELADLMIVPPVGALGLFESDRAILERLFRCGYETAVAALERSPAGTAVEPGLVAAGGRASTF